MNAGQVLFVDDEDDVRHAAGQALELAGFQVRKFSGADRLLGFVSPSFDGVIVSDIRMPGIDGLTFMQKVLEIDSDIPVILVTGHADVQLAVRAMRSGAYDFLEKPFATAHLATVVRNALDRRQLVLENRELRSVAGRRDDLEARLIGRVPEMVDLRRRIRAVANADMDVLITGPTGSGKEVAARALHDISRRAGKPFVAINCAALPENLIDSELFGHEAGAFSGAVRARFGKFELARGGTIFLDEIGALPLDVQARLLRVVEDRVVTRLGSNDAIPLDVRFIAASARDLESEAARNGFRSELLYRLNAVTLDLPPLSRRREDIPRLFVQLVNEAASRYRKAVPDVPSAVLTALAARDWPGNVRELRNAAERYVLGLEPVSDEFAGERSTKLADRVAAFEKSVLVAELIAQGGTLKRVYGSLGLSRKSLYEKMQKYGLRREDFSGGDLPESAD